VNIPVCKYGKYSSKAQDSFWHLTLFVWTCDKEYQITCLC